MGYYAHTVDVDFTIPAEKVPEARAAVVSKFGVGQESMTLTDVVEDLTSFQECEELAGGDFVLGYHCDKFVGGTEELLGVLALFASEGSYVRFNGEDDTLFGYRVVDGRLVTEWGDYRWRLASRQGDDGAPRDDNASRTGARMIGADEMRAAGLTENQVQEWALEAERGYSPEQIRPR